MTHMTGYFVISLEGTKCYSIQTLQCKNHYTWPIHLWPIILKMVGYAGYLFLKKLLIIILD